MKCTNKRKGSRRKNRRRNRNRLSVILICIIAVIGAAAVAAMILWDRSQDYILAYQYETYSKPLYQGSLFAADLCVTADDVELSDYEPASDLHAAGLFDLDSKTVVCGYHLFDRLYPASTTKIMTAYLAFKYGNPDDTVTVSAHATDFSWDEMICGLQEGDRLTLYDLICGLLLQSGNDCGTAIAEYISGSEEAFAELMNEEAAALGASGSHFVNPHGLHDENHYTTAYDLYLIFNACIQDQRFVDIISMDSYTASLTGADGSVREMIWEPTNYYSAGESEAPEGILVLGGKTGTTDQAGNCVILFEKNLAENPYISVIMGASDKTQLYDQMNFLLDAGVKR